MFIDITEKYTAIEKIKTKETLEKELFIFKPLLSNDDYEKLAKLLNLEETAFNFQELFNLLKNKFFIEDTNSNVTYDIILNIFQFNIFNFSLNFIRDFFEKRNLEFECKYSQKYGEIHLSYKNINLFGTCYVNYFLGTIPYFSCDLNDFLNKIDSIIIKLEKEISKNTFPNKNLSYPFKQEYYNLRTLRIAKSLKKDFSLLSNEDINIINEFYSEYIEYLKLPFSNLPNEIFYIEIVDISYPELFN